MLCENGDATAEILMRRNKLDKVKQRALDPLAVALNNFHENRVRLGLERKEICEDIAQTVLDRILRKIETADNRFRGKSVVSQGIPYDGLQAEEAIQLDMLVQLSFGKSSAVFFIKHEDEGLHVQPESSTVWKDCLSKNQFLSAEKVNKILRYYVAKAVKVLNRYIRKGVKEKLPKRLRSICMKDGSEIVLIVNKDITINLLPAFVLPDSRLDPARLDCPSSSHVVCRPHIYDSGRKMRIVWKWCFFVAEKNRIRALGGGSSCRVQLLRVLTEIRDTQEGLRMLSSYHLKHLLFHETDRLNDANDWASENIGERFTDLLRRLLSFLQERDLPHYFMQPPDFEAVNLFEEIDSESLQDMANAVLNILRDPCESLSCEGTEQRQSLWPWELELLSP